MEKPSTADDPKAGYQPKRTHPRTRTPTPIKKHTAKLLHVNLRIDGFKYLESLPPPANGLRRLRNRQVLIADEGSTIFPYSLRNKPFQITERTRCFTPKIISSSRSVNLPTELLENHRSTKTHHCEQRSVTVPVAVNQLTVKSESVVRRPRGRAKSVMKIRSPREVPEQVNVQPACEIECNLSLNRRALVAYSIDPILSSAQIAPKTKTPIDKVIPFLRQPLPSMFQSPPPTVFDNMGLLRHFITTFRALVAHPVVPNDSVTQQFVIRCGTVDSIKTVGPKFDTFDELAKQRKDSSDSCEIEVFVIPDDDFPAYSETTIIRKPNKTVLLSSSVRDSKRSIKSIVIPPEITVVMKKSTTGAKQPQKAAKRSIKHEIMITPVQSPKSTSPGHFGRSPKAICTTPLASRSVVPQKTPESMKFSPCLLVQCLPNIPVTMPYHASPNNAKQSNQKNKITPNLNGGGISKICYDSLARLKNNSGIRDKPTSDMKQRKPVAHKKVVNPLRHEAKMASCPQESQPIANPPIRTYQQSFQSTSNNITNSSALPFLSDQISYFPVTAASSSNRMERGSDNRSCKKRRIRENDICADCCEKEYIEHDSVSLIPIYDPDMITIDSDTGSVDSEVYYLIKPTHRPPTNHVGTQCTYKDIQLLTSRTTTLRTIYPSVYKSKQIRSSDNQLNSSTTSSQGHRSQRLSHEQTSVLQRLAPSPSSRIPVNADRPIGTKNQITSSDSLHFRLPSISTFEIRQYSSSTSISLVSHNSLSSYGTSTTKTVNQVHVSSANHTFTTSLTSTSCSRFSPPVPSESSFAFIPDTSHPSPESPSLEPFTNTASTSPTINRPPAHVINHKSLQDPWPVVVEDQGLQLEDMFQNIMEFLGEEAKDSLKFDLSPDIHLSPKYDENANEMHPEPKSLPMDHASNPLKPTTSHKRNSTKMCAYDRQLLTCKNVAVSSDERQAPRLNQHHLGHHATGELAFARKSSMANETMVHTKRNIHRCPSPISNPVAKRPNTLNELDIILRVDAPEFSLESLDDIPVDQLFVPDDEFNINDYF